MELPFKGKSQEEIDYIMLQNKLDMLARIADSYPPVTIIKDYEKDKAEKRKQKQLDLVDYIETNK